MVKAFIKLFVIDKPDETKRTIYKVTPPKTTVIRADGSIDYACGKCNTVLASGVHVGQIDNMVLFCNTCSSYNEASL
jgi:hypothetical protein